MDNKKKSIIPQNDPQQEYKTIKPQQEYKDNYSAYLIMDYYRRYKLSNKIKNTAVFLREKASREKAEKALREKAPREKEQVKTELQRKIKLITGKLLKMEKFPKFYDKEDFDNVKNSLYKLKQQYKGL